MSKIKSLFIVILWLWWKSRLLTPLPYKENGNKDNNKEATSKSIWVSFYRIYLVWVRFLHWRFDWVFFICFYKFRFVMMSLKKIGFTYTKKRDESLWWDTFRWFLWLVIVFISLFLVFIERRQHPAPFRTWQLSSSSPMILHLSDVGM